MTKAAVSPCNHRYDLQLGWLQPHLIVTVARAVRPCQDLHVSAKKKPQQNQKKNPRIILGWIRSPKNFAPPFPLGTYSHQTIHVLSSSTAHPGKIPDN